MDKYKCINCDSTFDQRNNNDSCPNCDATKIFVELKDNVTIPREMFEAMTNRIDTFIKNPTNTAAQVLARISLETLKKP